MKLEKNKGKIMLMVIIVGLLVVLGFTMETENITGAYSLDFFENNLEVIKYTQDQTCAGSEHEPCVTQIQFRALKDFKANPANMIEVASDNVKIFTQDEMTNFQKGHVYTLKYIAYKLNPSEDIQWSWGPIE